MEKTPNKFKISSKSGFRICLENWSFFQEPMGELESPTFSLPSKAFTLYWFKFIYFFIKPPHKTDIIKNLKFRDYFVIR